MDLTRKPDESFLDYADRLITEKDNKLLDIDNAEIYELLFGEQVSSDHARKCISGIRKTLEQYKLDPKSVQADEENELEEELKKKSSVEICNDGSYRSEKLLRMSEEQSKDVNYLLNAHGFSIDEWELVSARNNIWNVYSKQDGIQVLYSSKIVVKPKIQEFNIEWIKESFRELCDEFPSQIVGNSFIDLKADNMLEINLADVHFNKLAFASETGSECNHEITISKLNQVIDDIIVRTKEYKFEKILLPIGQDFLHIDTVDNTTTKGTRQDVSLKYKQMFKLAIKVFVGIIDKLSQIAPVEVFYVGGNHDKMLSYCLVLALEQRYYNNENVFVDNSEMIRQYKQFGKCLIGFAHGDEEKNRINKLMPVEVPKMWGETKYREMHCSHLHKEMLIDESNGLIVRRISSICGIDTWTYESGYVGTVRKAQSFIWNKEYGLISIINSVVN